MAYLNDICLPLIKVLEGANFHKRARLAGYAANVDFWVDEIRHCLEAIAGYDLRYSKLTVACKDYALRHREEPDDAWVARSMSDEELRRLDHQLRAAAQRFLKLCCEDNYIDFSKQREIEQLLGIDIKYSREPT